MKVFIWLLLVAIEILCLTCCLVAGWVQQDLSHRGFTALPAVTAFLFKWPFWFLLCPLPWFAYAVVLARRQDLSIGSVLGFAGSLSVAASGIVFITVAAALVPYVWMGS